MTFDRCPCCEITALPHASDCTFAVDCRVECEQFDEVAELRAEIARLRLTDAERQAITNAISTLERWQQTGGYHSAVSDEVDALQGVLERLG